MAAKKAATIFKLVIFTSYFAIWTGKDLFESKQNVQNIKMAAKKAVTT